MFWSKVKSILRSIAPRTTEQLHKAITLSLSILFPNLTSLAGFMNVTLVPRSFENRYTQNFGGDRSINIAKNFVFLIERGLDAIAKSIYRPTIHTTRQAAHHWLNWHNLREHHFHIG